MVCRGFESIVVLFKLDCIFVDMEIMLTVVTKGTM